MAETTTAPMPTRLGKIHECSGMNRAGLCTRGTGSPKHKTCAYCGSAIRVTEGLHGVFVWDGKNRYWASDAKSWHTTDAKAQAVVDADKTGTLVVRFASAAGLDSVRPEGHVI